MKLVINNEKLLDYISSEYIDLLDEKQLQHLLLNVTRRLKFSAVDIDDNKNKGLICSVVESEFVSLINIGKNKLKILQVYFDEKWELEPEPISRIRGLVEFINSIELETDNDYWIGLLKQYPCVVSEIEQIIASIPLEILLHDAYYYDVSQVVTAYSDYKLIVDGSYKSSDVYFNKDLLDIYNRQAKKYPLLTPEEERMYLSKIAQGDEQAKEYFIACNLRLVIHVASYFEGCGLELLDLIQIGNVGLINAVNSFEPTRAERFANYACNCIRNKIIGGISNEGTLNNYSWFIRKQISELEEMTKNLTVKQGYKPTEKELAEALGWSIPKVKKTTELVKREVISLHSTVPVDGDSLEPRSLIVNPDECYGAIDVCSVRDVILYAMRLARLNEKEAASLLLSNGFYNDRLYIQDEIAAMFGGVTRPCIMNAKITALEKMKKTCIMRLISSFLAGESSCGTYRGLSYVQYSYLKEISEREFDNMPCSLMHNMQFSSEVMMSHKESITEIMQLANLTRQEMTVLLYRDGFYDGSIHTYSEIKEILKSYMNLKKINEVENSAANKMRRLYALYRSDVRKVSQSYEQSLSFSEDKVSLYSYFSRFSKEQIESALRFLPVDELLIIKKKYGNDYQSGKMGSLNYDEKRICSQILAKITRLLIRESSKVEQWIPDSADFSATDYRAFRFYIDSLQFKDALKSLKLEDAFIAVLLILEVNGKYMPLNVIGMLCEIPDEDRLVQIINSGIEIIKERFGINTIQDRNISFQKLLVQRYSQS